MSRGLSPSASGNVTPTGGAGGKPSAMALPLVPVPCLDKKSAPNRDQGKEDTALVQGGDLAVPGAGDRVFHLHQTPPAPSSHCSGTAGGARLGFLQRWVRVWGVGAAPL